MSDPLWPHGLQHTRPPCPSPTPGVYSNSCPLSQWCHPTISSLVHIYLSHKKWNLAIMTTWMNLEGILLSKISQTEEDKYRMVSLVCGIWKTTKKGEARHTVNSGCQGLGLREGRNGKRLVKGYKLSVIRWLNFFFLAEPWGLRALIPSARDRTWNTAVSAES